MAQLPHLSSKSFINTGRQQLSVRRKSLFSFFAILLGLFAGLLMAEFSVRMLSITPPKMISKRQLIPLNSDGSVYYHCYPDNPQGEFSPLPDVAEGEWKLQEYTFEQEPLKLVRLSETPWCVEYRHSSKGIRDREFSVVPASDLIRLGVVGDSFVFGEGVPVELTLPSQLQLLLGEKYECVNAGQVGANAEQEMVILDAIIREANCQRALLVLIPNDIPLTPELAEAQDYINDFILIRDRYLERMRGNRLFGGRSRLFDLMNAPSETSKIRNDTIEWYHNCYSPSRNGRNLRWMQEQLNALAARQDCQTAIVLYPLLENMEQDYPLEEVHQVLARMINHAGLPLLDLTETFQGQKSSELWVHETDHHPNGKAHLLAAQAIAEWFQKEDLWYPLPRQTTE